MAGGKLIFDKYTENLAEIAMAFAAVVPRYPKLTDTDSIAWKQKFVEWANEFEELHPDIEDDPDKDYLILIEDFAREKIFEFGGIERPGRWLKWENAEEWGKIQCPMLDDECVMTYCRKDAPCYYSYTAPFVDEDGDVCCYRYDHDEGCWDEDTLFCIGVYSGGDNVRLEE